MAARVERVVVIDEERKSTIVELVVERAISLTVDCGCWKHGGRGHLFEILITLGGSAYVRATGDHAYRTIDMSGPITLAIERSYRPD